jgi:DNA polymerase-4
MHIDLNSCYAIIEQQANRLLRNKPLGVAAYTSPGGFIIASSYEAKRQGIKLMRIRDAKEIDPSLYILAPDPEKYFDAHRRFKTVLERYTDLVTPKSIDEFIVDFQGSHAVQKGQSLVDVGYQIKKEIKEALGEYVTVNIGIAPNRFLAKVAAGLDKPDGLNVIEAQDIYNVYGQMELVDLPGINYRFERRLKAAGIHTPLDFLEANVWKLKGEVFKSIIGYYWYLRLRGHEVDSQKFPVRSFGNDFAIREWTYDREQIKRYIMKLSEKTGRRLRKHDYQSYGVYLGLAFQDGTWWGKSKKSDDPIYSTQEIYANLMKLFKMVNFPAPCTHVNISVFNVRPANPIQLGLFDEPA